MKPRILFVNEFSQLCTGFATYMYYVLPRLHETGKYEIAELATYAHEAHPKMEGVPWKVYPNEPHPENEKAREIYHRDRLNQFGKFRFEEVCLDFKPDIVVSIRDWWMDEWIEKSPFRKYFKWITMPTVDGDPQKLEWLDTYKKADAILTYSLWGSNLLERQTKGEIKPLAFASPGCDIDIFQKPEDRKEAKKKIGMRGDARIIQTVMRNQPRKLYPDLFVAFNKFLDICKENDNDELAKNTFLYCHTTQPDVGWDLVQEIRKYKLSHKVLFTYMCEKCGTFYPAFYSGEVNMCRNCRNHIARLPNTSVALEREQLADVMAVADLYIQYSICEGWGMPINDAKSCGVPVLAVDYSAMAEQAYNGGALPIKIGEYFQEPIHQTYQLRVRPDNDHCAEQMYKVLSNDEYHEQLSIEARECAENIYNWDNVAKVWEGVFDETELLNIDKTWLSPPRILPIINPPPNQNNEQFVHWIFTELIKDPEKIYTFDARKMINMLNLGYEAIMGPEGRPQRIPVTRENILQNMQSHVNHRNQLEHMRHVSIHGSKTTENKYDLNFSEI